MTTVKNAERMAKVALVLMQKYEMSDDKNPAAMALSQLLTGTLHFADQLGLNWAECLEIARQQFQRQKEEV